jgi:ATP10 protein
MFTPCARRFAGIINTRSRAVLNGSTVRIVACSQPSRGIKLFDRLIPEDDPETKKAKDLEREIIKKKLGRSKIAEMLSVHKDKKFMATASIEPAATASPFPAGCAIQHLGEKENGMVFDPVHSAFKNHKLTLVTIGFQAISQKQLEAWLAQAVQRLPRLVSVTEPKGDIALLNIVYLDGWFFKMMKSFFAKSVKEGVPEAVREMSGIAFSSSEKETDHLMEMLGVHNRVMGYCFLVDSNGRIRWR